MTTANLPFIETIHLKNILSFGPESNPIQLGKLNVIIGPNGSGKSNLIEIFDVLRASPDTQKPHFW